MNDVQKWLLRNAILAALYAVLTLILTPISYGPVQVRLSEVLTLLAFYNKRWVPGLTLGCLLANIGSPFGLTDMVIGTLATFLAVLPMHKARNLYKASLLPVLTNGVLIGGELYYLAALPPETGGFGIMASMMYVAVGEWLSVTIVGQLVFRTAMRNEEFRKYVE